MRFFIDVDTLINNHGINTYGSVINFMALTLGGLVVIGGCIWYLQKEFSRSNNVDLV